VVFHVGASMAKKLGDLRWVDGDPMPFSPLSLACLPLLINIPIPFPTPLSFSPLNNQLRTEVWGSTINFPHCQEQKRQPVTVRGDRHQIHLVSEFFPGILGDSAPPTAAKLCALSLFFGRDNELQIYHVNFLLTDNKHRKLFISLKQSKVCKFMPKMHQSTFGGRAQPGPAGGAYALLQTP